MIKIENVAFRDISVHSLSIPEGFCAVFGPNGSGKSTLLRIIAGMELPESGKVTVGGLPPREIECGYISEFPDRNIIFERVADEISSPLKFRHTDSKETGEKIGAVIEKIGISRLYDRNVTKLSGGEKVMIALATAVAVEPDLLVIDEADSHLDEETAGELFEAIMKMDIPHVVFCTHNMERIKETADFALYLDNGRIELSGTPGDLFSELAGTCFCPGEADKA